MNLSDIIKDLQEKEKTCIKNIEELQIKLQQEYKALSIIRGMLGKSEEAPTKGESKRYIKKIRTPSLIIIAMGVIGNKGNKAEIMDAIQGVFKLSPTQSEMICRNYLGKMVNNGTLSKDDSGPLRIYSYSGPMVEYDVEKHDISKSIKNHATNTM